MGRRKPPFSSFSSATCRRGAAFSLPPGWNRPCTISKSLQFSGAEIEWLESTRRFGANLIDYLAALRFTGDVHAMPEGTVFFANEPIFRVTAPLPQAQLVESRLINILHYQTLVAAKAARVMLAAPNKVLVDFGFRRAHGAEAGLMAARASYLMGFAGTATVLAGKEFGIPVYGTMAHSFIESFDDEIAAFTAFAQARPNNLVLLIDTYDTEAAARKVVALAPKLKEAGIVIGAVRLDSGDLVALSRSVRAILDAGGLRDVTIFASGGLDEDSLIAFAKANAPIDGFGIGTSMTTSSDVPSLDCRLQIAGLCRCRAAQALGEQSHLAGPQAGLAALRCRRPHDWRYAFAGRRQTNRRAIAAACDAEWPALASAAFAR